MLKDQIRQVKASRIIFFRSKNISLVDICFTFRFDAFVEIFHPLIQFLAHFLCSLVG